MAATLELEKPARKSRARGGEPKSSSGKRTGQAKKLFDLLTSNDLAGAVEVWRAGLKAVKRAYDPQSRKWYTTPDYKERRENGLAIAAYMEGKPVERQMQITGSFEDLSDLLKAMRGSGEAARLMPVIDSLPSA